MIKRTIFIVGFLVFAAFWEASASHIADQTRGWPLQLLILMVSLFLDLLVLTVCFFRFRLGVIVGFSYLVWVSVYIAPLGIRWHFIDGEAKHIVAWAYAEQMKAGSYPDDLSGYSFLRPEYKGYIFYTAGDYTGGGIKPKAQSFEVSYIVEPPDGTNHRYDSRYTQYGWQYQDD